METQIEKYNGKNNSLIITFSGFFEIKDKIVPYNFKQIFLNEKYKSFSKIFMRDIENAWYLNGLKNENLFSINDIVNYLTLYIKDKNIKNIYLFGSSMGRICSNISRKNFIYSFVNKYCMHSFFSPDEFKFKFSFIEMNEYKNQREYFW